jgi:hypothetical protein
MDMDEFDAALREVRPGQYADIPYEIFEMLFPPGVQSDDAKGAAYDYERSCNEQTSYPELIGIVLQHMQIYQQKCSDCKLTF